MDDWQGISRDWQPQVAYRINSLLKFPENQQGHFLVYSRGEMGYYESILLSQPEELSDEELNQALSCIFEQMKIEGITLHYRSDKTLLAQRDTKESA